MPNDSHLDLDDDAQDGESTSMTTSLTSRELQQLLDANRANAVKQAGEQSVLDDVDLRKASTKGNPGSPKPAAPAKPAVPLSSHPAARLFQNPGVEDDLAELLTPSQKERVRQAEARGEALDMTTLLTPQQLMTLKLLQEQRLAYGEESAEKKWWEIIPVWGWILSVLAGGTLLAGTALRVTMTSSPDLQFLAGMGCLVSGALMFLTTHIMAYVKAVHVNGKLGVMDFFLKPITVWQPTFQELPETQRRVICGGWSVALFCTALMLCGKDLMSITEKQWAAKRAPKNMLQEIVKKARSEEGGGEEKSTKEALNEFAGEDKAKEPEEEKGPDISNWPRMDCLVIGYVPDPNGDFESLILASVVKNQLRYVGTVTPREMGAVDRSQLYSRLSDPELARETSLLKTPMGGKWVRPLLMVRVAYDEMKNNGMNKTVLTDLLQDIE